MSDPTPDQVLANVQTNVVNGLKTALTIAGVANPAVLATTFAAEAIFRVFRLVKEIKRKQQEISSTLTEAIRQSGVLAETVPWNMTVTTLQTHFRPGGHAQTFETDLYKALLPEATDVTNNGGLASIQTLKALKFAKENLSPLYPVTAAKLVPRGVILDSYLHWMTAQNPRYGEVARDAARLMTDEEFASDNDVQSHFQDYFQQKLQAEMVNLAQLQLAAQEQMNQAWKQAIQTALFGDGALISKGLTFSKNMRLDQLTQEIAALDALITSEPTSPLLAARKQKKAELEALKARVNALS